jgi:predicted CoA-substrate-specific enzyme activase
MAVVGIDAGLKTLKIVILEGNEILAAKILKIGKDSIAVAAEKILSEAVESARITHDELQYTVATGASRQRVPYAQKQSPESMCLAKGIEFLMPSFSGTVLDIGAHKALAIRCQNGMSMNIARSDKCAAGAGEYLEMASEMLSIPMSEMGDSYRKSQDPTVIQSSCSVFAETEIISLLHQRKRPEDILKGALKGFAARVYPLLMNVGGLNNIVIAGAVARNQGVVQAIEEQIGHELIVPDNPDIIGALGAALTAREQVGSNE